MTVYIRYRVADSQSPWEENSIKGEPLTNQEIDRNWSSVVSELDKKANIDGQTLTGTVLVDSKTAFGIPYGKTEERPTSPLVKGMIRFNTDNSNLEMYNGSAWQVIGKIAQGGDQDEVFYLNDKVITTSYTIPDGKNAMTAGPVTLEEGVVITVPEGSTWTIVGDDVPSSYTTYVGPTTVTG